MNAKKWYDKLINWLGLTELYRLNTKSGFIINLSTLKPCKLVIPQQSWASKTDSMVCSQLSYETQGIIRWQHTKWPDDPLIQHFFFYLIVFLYYLLIFLIQFCRCGFSIEPLKSTSCIVFIFGSFQDEKSLLGSAALILLKNLTAVDVLYLKIQKASVV